MKENNVDKKLREILEAVEEQGEINAGKGEKKYIPHMTIDQALSQINQLFSEGKEEVVNKNYPLGEFDAVKWAKEFMRIYGNKKLAPQNHPDNLFPKEDDMRGWFANAIMTGYDIGHHKGKDVDSNKTIGKDKEVEEAIRIIRQYRKTGIVTLWKVENGERINLPTFENAVDTLIDAVERKI